MKYGSVCSEKVDGRTAKDISGQVFGRLTVLHRSENRPQGGGKPRWVCKCTCGNMVNVPGSRLRNESTKSCGCLRKDRMGDTYRKHGKSKTPQYTMFYDARKRAIALSLPFEIEPDDIVIPDVCPVLGIFLDSSDRNHTPSLDRILPSLGYTKENISVISFKANRMKGDASIHDLEKVIAYIRSRL